MDWCGKRVRTTAYVGYPTLRLCFFAADLFLRATEIYLWRCNIGVMGLGT
jgi:hypothetical protein